MEFDETDLNRLYEALVNQIETYNGDPDWAEELDAYGGILEVLRKAIPQQWAR